MSLEQELTNEILIHW